MNKQTKKDAYVHIGKNICKGNEKEKCFANILLLITFSQLMGIVMIASGLTILVRGSNTFLGFYLFLNGIFLFKFVSISNLKQIHELAKKMNIKIMLR